MQSIWRKLLLDSRQIIQSLVKSPWHSVYSTTTVHDPRRRRRAVRGCSVRGRPQPLCCVHSVVVVEAAEEATNLPTEKGNSRRRSLALSPEAPCSLQFYSRGSGARAVLSVVLHDSTRFTSTAVLVLATARSAAARHVTCTPPRPDTVCELTPL